MKDAAARLKTPLGTPRQRGSTPSTSYGGVPEAPALFFRSICKAAGMERKQVAGRMRVSDTTVDRWFSGERNDPIERAREFCGNLFALKRGDLVVAVLVYIAGDEDFDGRVLTAEENSALKKLMGKGE